MRYFKWHREWTSPSHAIMRENAIDRHFIPPTYAQLEREREREREVEWSMLLGIFQTESGSSVAKWLIPAWARFTVRGVRFGQDLYNFTHTLPRGKKRCSTGRAHLNTGVMSADVGRVGTTGRRNTGDTGDSPPLLTGRRRAAAFTGCIASIVCRTTATFTTTVSATRKVA